MTSQTRIICLQEVDTADAKRYAQEIGALFFETSAKSSDATGKVQEMFVELARMLPSVAREAATISDVADLREPKGGKGSKKESGGCC